MEYPKNLKIKDGFDPVGTKELEAAKFSLILSNQIAIMRSLAHILESGIVGKPEAAAYLRDICNVSCAFAEKITSNQLDS